MKWRSRVWPVSAESLATPDFRFTMLRFAQSSVAEIISSLISVYSCFYQKVLGTVFRALWLCRRPVWCCMGREIRY